MLRLPARSQCVALVVARPRVNPEMGESRLATTHVSSCWKKMLYYYILLLNPVLGRIKLLFTTTPTPSVNVQLSRL
ncbi:hypothetical protein B0J12DRAFT_386744 [Macrophomina phaseolina]|uniref:Secreted protein n=1 Tax=Macrophomina phaseolina TaxID=35725 RepID=A0ABQ8FSU8_9PEZI|nr:hypothetical protein B0J12DRAFT_386744 [Macrophomina phaseolina]